MVFLQIHPQTDDNSRFNAFEPGYLVVSIHTAHFDMYLFGTDTESGSDVVLHFRQALFHARLFSTVNGHIHRSQEEVVRFNQVLTDTWQVVDRFDTGETVVREPVVNITCMSGCG